MGDVLFGLTAASWRLVTSKRRPAAGGLRLQAGAAANYLLLGLW